jgi:hypothetical protein
MPTGRKFYNFAPGAEEPWYVRNWHWNSDYTQNYVMHDLAYAFSANEATCWQNPWAWLNT